MKYAGKTFTLTHDQPVAVQGSDSLYTYQNIGTATATITGSNNGENWNLIATVPSASSYIATHSYAFIKMSGATTVLVVRGAAGNTEITKARPLPTALDAKTSIIQAIIEEANFYYKITAPAVFGKYTAVQLWNPSDSGVVIIVGPINGYNSAGTMTWTRIKSTAPLTTLEGDVQNNCFGSEVTSKLKLYYDALTSLTGGNDFGKPSISTTGGTGSAATSGQYVLRPNTGIQLEGNTVNIGMSLLGNVTEIPLANFN